MRRTGVVALFWVMLPGHVWAHRLDEYLQATLIGVTRGGIDLEIHLTPGVQMLPALLPMIDRDRDGRISSVEERAYVSRVMRDLELRVDRVPAALSLIESSFPTVDAMREGVGTIVIKMRAAARGHELRFENRHLPQVSVYLVNCLAGDSESLKVGRPVRDEAQKSMEFEYSFGGDSGWGYLWPSAIGMLVIARMTVVIYKAKHLR